jgi:hypothetical protein
MAVWLATSVAAGQTPRRIAPELFPDYGVRAEPQPAAPRIELPSDTRPLGACARDMSAAIWLRCLRETASATDDALVGTVETIKASFEQRMDVTPVLRAAWSRGLDESLTRWRALRDYECGQLALAEPQATRDLLEARNTCLINRNRERAAELLRRYGRAAESPSPATP